MIRRLFIAQARHADEWPDVNKAGTWVLYDPDKQVARTLPDVIQFNVIGKRRTALRTVPYSRGKALTVSHDPFSSNFKSIQAVINRGFAPRGAKPYAYTVGPELLIFIHGYGPATYFSGCESAKQALDRITINPTTVYEGRIQPARNAYGGSWYNPVFKGTDFSWERRSRFTEELTEFENARDESRGKGLSPIEPTSFVQITTDLPDMSDEDLGKFLRQQIAQERTRTRITGRSNRPRSRLSLEKLLGGD